MTKNDQNKSNTKYKIHELQKEVDLLKIHYKSNKIIMPALINETQSTSRRIKKFIDRFDYVCEFCDIIHELITQLQLQMEIENITGCIPHDMTQNTTNINNELSNLFYKIDLMINLITKIRSSKLLNETSIIVEIRFN